MMKRKEAREELLCLLFEAEFRPDESAEDIYAISAENRQIPEIDYVKTGFFTIQKNRDKIDELIGAHSKGWKISRMTRISRSILRLCVWEMLYEKIPYAASINEAVELAKKYDEDKARAFINGILNSVKEQLESEGEGEKAPGAGE